MYKINEELIIRDDDKSLFSLENMEVYEFNEIGFKVIKIISEQKLDNYNDLEKQISDIDGADTTDMKDFFDALLKHKIVINDR